MNLAAIRKSLTIIGCAFFVITFCKGQSRINIKPLRLAVAGLTHDHVSWILSRKKPDVELVGIYESDTVLSNRYAKQYKLDKKLFYTDLNIMLTAMKPEAVAAFGSIYEHAAVVEACAPKRIHIMVEKPLATNIVHARKMQQLAKQNNVYLLTNYETSWYPSTAKTYRLVNDSNFVGKIRKVIIHDGHQGPKEIGVSKEFLHWLTDPVQNGGGALTDFGCYGANLMTYLMKGQKPLSVTAVTRRFRPDIYSKVDDEATIVMSYAGAQCIIQASWNWPFGRKDMEVYGENGYIIAKDKSNMVIRTRAGDQEKAVIVAGEPGVYEDPFTYLADVIREKIKIPANGLYSLENNLTVVEILEAARESARTGKTVYLK